jgi:2-keto-3-deoxy-L-fuconate dehydrogenase
MVVARASHGNQPVGAVRQAFVDRQPMGRLGAAKETAMFAVYLAFDKSSYSTGQIHLADGGFSL